MLSSYQSQLPSGVSWISLKGNHCKILSQNNESLHSDIFVDCINIPKKQSVFIEKLTTKQAWVSRFSGKIVIWFSYPNTVWHKVLKQTFPVCANWYCKKQKYKSFYKRPVLGFRKVSNIRGELTSLGNTVVTFWWFQVLQFYFSDHVKSWKVEGKYSWTGATFSKKCLWQVKLYNPSLPNYVTFPSWGFATPLAAQANNTLPLNICRKG